MPDFLTEIELELTPIPPDTIASAKEELLPLIKSTLRDAGRADLLSKDHLQVQIEKTFPTDAAIIVGLTLLSGVALETYKSLLLPRLKKRFEVKQKPKARRPVAKPAKRSGKQKTSQKKQVGRGKK